MAQFQKERVRKYNMFIAKRTISSFLTNYPESNLEQDPFWARCHKQILG